MLPDRGNSEQGKIFGIGYPKTATSSLSNALAKLGYRSVHDPYDVLPVFFPEELHGFEYDSQVNAGNDVLSGLVYRELDRSYPGSKFILTIRDEQKLLNSVRAHLKNNTAIGKLSTGNASSACQEKTVARHGTAFNISSIFVKQRRIYATTE